MSDVTPSAPSRREAPVPPTRALRTVNLRTQLVDSLRARLSEGEWVEGQQLPTEGELAGEYGVSRSTVRSALQQLETQGLTITRHGMGTFVSSYGRAIKAGLQELRSMTDTIRVYGMEPRVEYHDAQFRGATDDEAVELQITSGTRVLSTERVIFADDVAVAFSYETVPGDVLPADLSPSELSGSLFSALDSAGSPPHTAVAEIHAAGGDDIGWGDREPDAVYVYLKQLHYDANARPVLFSRTYFHEGRFQFSILRVR